jgi:hypothetical protein
LITPLAHASPWFAVERAGIGFYQLALGLEFSPTRSGLSLDEVSTIESVLRVPLAGIFRDTVLAELARRVVRIV